jgi:ribosomal protein S18 acetylase RimI-like enzyme
MSLKNNPQNSPWRIAVSDRDDSRDAQAIHEGLRSHVEAMFGPAERKPVVITSTEGEILKGGLRGSIHWKWLYITHLWVENGSQGKGLGRFLLAEAERVARDNQCVGLYVDTFEEKVAGFYKKNGFKETGRIENFPAGRENEAGKAGARVFLSREF